MKVSLSNKINTSIIENKKISFKGNSINKDSIALSGDSTIRNAKLFVINSLQSDNPIEFAVLIDNKKNKTICQLSGESNFVKIPPKYLLLTLNPFSDITYLHGHPSRNNITPTFSFGDMRMFLLNPGIKTMYAIGENREEYIFEKERKPKNKKELLKELSTKEQEFNQEIWAIKGGARLQELIEKANSANSDEERGEIATEIGMALYGDENNNADYTDMYARLDKYWIEHAKDYGVKYSKKI